MSNDAHAVDHYINEMRKQLIEANKKIERYENIIFNIANIDTLFYLPDGTEREWDDKEALQEIERLVMPVWNEHCEESNKRMREKFEELGVKVKLD